LSILSHHFIYPETQISAMPETQLPVMISQPTQLPYTYPMVTNLFDVVPLPFTQEYAAPAGTVVAPNSLRLVHKFGGTLADFPSNPHTFSITGCQSLCKCHASQNPMGWQQVSKERTQGGYSC
jgi:hypothetical protein